MLKKLKLKGKKFGILTVICESKIKIKGNTNWLCQCNCGKKCNVVGIKLRSGQKKSCGCRQRRMLTDEDSFLSSVYRGYKDKAKQRKFSFLLNKEFFKKLIFSNCYYCNKKFSMIKIFNKTKFKYNGVDRIDSGKGYFKKNVVSCCTDCNRMKWNNNLTNFYNQIKKIVKNLKLEKKYD